MNYQNYYPNYLQNYQTSYQAPQAQASPQATQEQSAFISVQDEQQARNWPIAPGASLTFKNEKEPYIYTKTAGLSQFEQPVFEKYRITKEEDPKVDDVKAELTSSISDINSQIEEIKDAYRLLKSEIDDMKSWMRQPFMSTKAGE